MDDLYYDENEKKFVIQSVRTLLHALRNEITTNEIRQIRSIITKGINEGHAQRDKYGINPTVRHLNTAVLVTQYIAADKHMVIAILLYHLCENEFISKETIRAEFGDDVLSLIKGLLKVDELYKKQTALQDENFSRLMMIFAENIRVIIIMIIDRLGLMKMINHHPNQKFVFDVSNEALYLYTPLAHRLGLYKVKSELEDMFLKYTNRELYTQIAHKLNETKRERNKYIADFIAPVEQRLHEANLKFEIKGRTKSIYSIWNKMRKQNADVSDIYDLFAIRIIIDTPLSSERTDCWAAFAIVTDMFRANPSRMKDWITIPKSNGYESLHTTVYGPGDRWVEVQIRTRRMDEIAEKGLAAHWKYKGIKSEKSLDDWMANVRDLLETSGKDTPELMKKMNLNIYDKEVFIFTPKGDLHKLPYGATLLDFAFAIHSQLGCTCIGGKVNGKNQKINYKLQNGDTVEVLTSSSQQPKQQWLSFVTTSKARNKIRQSLNEIDSHAAELAKEMLHRRLKNRKIDLDDLTLTRIVKKFGLKTTSELYLDIAHEKITMNEIVDFVTDANVRKEQPANRSAQEYILQPVSPENPEHADIISIGEGIKGINYKLSKCCNPIQGDKVLGFISSDGAIKVHKCDCPNARHLINKYPYRIIKAQWADRNSRNQFTVPISIIGTDDIGIVNNITSLISKEKTITLRNISIDSYDGLFQGRLTIGVSDTDALNNLIKKIKTIKGIKNVQRTN